MRGIFQLNPGEYIYCLRPLKLSMISAYVGWIRYFFSRMNGVDGGLKANKDSTGSKGERCKFIHILNYFIIRRPYLMNLF